MFPSTRGSIPPYLHVEPVLRPRVSLLMSAPAHSHKGVIVLPPSIGFGAHGGRREPLGPGYRCPYPCPSMPPNAGKGAWQWQLHGGVCELTSSKLGSLSSVPASQTPNVLTPHMSFSIFMHPHSTGVRPAMYKYSLRAIPSLKLQPLKRPGAGQDPLLLLAVGDRGLSSEPAGHGRP